MRASLPASLHRLVCIGLVIIAGVVVIVGEFQSLNDELDSLAYTGELARPLLEDGATLANNFNSECEEASWG